RPLHPSRARRRGRAHRVVRDRGHHPRARHLDVKEITPRGDAYRGAHVQLDLPVLVPGTAVAVAAPDGIEAALVLLTGDVEIDGRRARRADVFDARATAVYLPPDSSVEITAHAPTELALAATVGGDLHAPPD